jgi:DNA repair exonuclease SbcCD nuclease subunit
MKFLHAADIHLDSPLAGLARRGEIPTHVTQHCTRRAFMNLIDLAITEDVAFVLIAGDLYDGDWRDFSTGLFFNEQMRRLARPCILIRGNHDAASIISKQLTMPANVHEMSARKVDRWASDELGVVIHGRSFPDRHIPEDLSDSYPGPEAGRLSIAMLHTSGENPGEHEVYAPCRIGALAAKGYAYWALGHIHERRVLHESPYIVFPGNIQGRHVREQGAKGVTLVEVADRRIVGISHRPTDVVRWAQIAVALDGAESLADAAMRVRFALEAQAAALEGRPLLARINLEGATKLHAAISADPEAMRAECQNAAFATGADIHIEKVALLTRVPREEGAGPGAELEAAFSLGLDDPDLVQRLLTEFTRLRQDIPYIHGRAPPDLPQSADDLRALLGDAWILAAEALSAGEIS